MLANGYVPGQVFGQTPSYPFSKFVNQSQLGANALNQYPTNDLNSLSDWRKDPRISFFRDLVREKIAESCKLELQEQGSNIVNVLENKLFMEAVSEEEYMNLDVLRERLQNFYQKDMVDLNCSQQVSSYSGPTCEVLPALGLTHSCNSDAAYPPFNHFNNDITDYNPMMAGNNDQFSFLKGFLDSGNKLGLASLYCDSHMRKISNELLPSHDRSSVITSFSDRGSTITRNSNSDKVSEIGAYEGGPFFSKGVADDLSLPAMAFSSTLRESSEFPNSILQMSELVPQLISEDTIFPSMDFSIMNSTLGDVVQPKSHIQEQKQQRPYSSYEQFSNPLEMAGEIVPIHSHFPSEQIHGVHIALESSSLLSSSNGIAGPANPSNHLHFSVEHKSLHAYSSCKSPAIPADQFNTSKRHQSFQNMYNGLMMDSSTTGTGGSGSCASENMLPPTKRFKPSSDSSENLLTPSKDLKIEKSSCLLSYENRIASILAPLMVQPPFPKGLPPLLQLPESPVSINSEVLDGNIEFSKPMQNPSSVDQVRNSAGYNLLRMNAENLHTPSEEQIVDGPRTQEIDCSSFGEIADAVKDKPNEVYFNKSPALSEELGATSREEVIQVMSNFDHAKPDLETKKEEEMEPENLKTRGVSLIEFFSADEIKDHISSLQQWIGQRMSKGGKEKQVMHCANENTCQLCAADKLLLAPVPIYCSCCGSRIKCNVNYYSTSEENGMRHCFCTSCYRDSRGGSITFFGISILKAKLVKKKNDDEIEESWVQCDKCKHWQHQICALFNDIRDMEGKSEYVCPKCCLEEIEQGEHLPLPRAAVFSAKDLPTTLLSDYIEQRLFRRLQQEKEESAKALGRSLDEVPGADDLVVRVVLSVDKQLKVKQQFLEIFHDGNYPDEFPYRSKVILLFQKIEGVDVCLFGMYVQEFGSECSQPNHRCVYISYLDSVKYFRPDTKTAAGEALRTVVYHEILIGYLEYCKKRGFIACYLWACPPLKEEDYILYCHPEIQKTPKSDKLRQWYHSMLRKAAKENIVVDFTNLYDHFFVPTGHFYCKVTAARLPYFDGDYWSGAAENVIKNIEQQNGEHSGRKVKKVMTKRTLKALGHTNPSGGVTKDIILMQKLGQTIFPFKEDFIIVHLRFVCSYCHEVIFYGWRWCCNQCKNFQLCERCHDMEQGLNGGETHAIGSKEKHLLSKVMVDDIPSDTKDEDAILDNWLFENRHTFLGFCHKNHYQFDTLRRAKHSSMMILHHLHNPTIPTTGETCSICQQDTDTTDSNVCATCYNEKFGSLHIRRSTYHYYAANCENESISAQRKMHKLKELLDVLQHASQCEATNCDPCSYPNCLQIKRLFCHASKCPIRISRGCVPCKKVWFILKLHAGNCGQTDCCIPRCRDLKARS
ncbi:histone acetyltransferase HAC12 isoform X1 [Hevea brasiliensis]|uniref:histone acetyltransferase HAC12 isoform X1 n=2 Tax=Hevea brasiliensis TaxID=3981 RepID=UPI0025EDF6AD|nr:histone acetyltransferase HAC12 isoform X1 [Hevea brasiliensis]XP_058009360.1 histone acetyltransferase HAC12 isoform X1 [Hevea brasiliensis]XP_058009361.1 histone acetyltransferase HAC12 isoform X1 [Hevea brasiliensis]XP_058009362.1 histone acetyltransferase HAC12 isoform X1 [Hevea brasiliensis]XP_058009363.1 histone acetyltransferase HAC12 isoform X1 [Hevea brasiliensis]XP_058009364.1 histone acetyltransferase HAC12 isoform X1 [Hevea brasiliensis]